MLLEDYNGNKLSSSVAENQPASFFPPLASGGTVPAARQECEEGEKFALAAGLPHG